MKKLLAVLSVVLIQACSMLPSQPNDGVNVQVDNTGITCPDVVMPDIQSPDIFLPEIKVESPSVSIAVNLDESYLKTSCSGLAEASMLTEMKELRHYIESKEKADREPLRVSQPKCEVPTLSVLLSEEYDTEIADKNPDYSYELALGFIQKLKGLIVTANKELTACQSQQK